MFSAAEQSRMSVRLGSCRVSAYAMHPDTEQVLAALCRSAAGRKSSVLALRRVASAALAGDSQRAAKALRELDAMGYVRTDTMGWYTGWLTERGRQFGESARRRSRRAR